MINSHWFRWLCYCATFKSNHQFCIWKFGDEFSSESRRHFQCGGFFIWIFQLTSNEKFVSRLSHTLRFFSLLPLIGQPAYLPIWQIKMLHSFMYSIIRFTRLSCSIIQNVDGVTNFFILFYDDHFSIGALDRIESKQSSINNWRNRIVSKKQECKSLHKTILQSAVIVFHLKWTGGQFF